MCGIGAWIENRPNRIEREHRNRPTHIWALHIWKKGQGIFADQQGRIDYWRMFLA